VTSGGELCWSSVPASQNLRKSIEVCLALQESLVLDIVFLALVCVLFLIGAGYAVLCDRL
jgi:hypothetical protein